MSRFIRTLTFLMLLGSFGNALPASDSAPPGLPQPPPLPDDLRDKRPHTPPPELPDPSQLIEQLKQLQELLSMSPERLQKLRDTIEFIEGMSPAEREAMHIRLSQITRMTDDLREEIKELARHVPSLAESDVSQFWLSNSPSDRQSFRTSFSALSDAQKTEFLKDAVRSFTERRDEVFARMRETLESKRRRLHSPQGKQP